MKVIFADLKLFLTLVFFSLILILVDNLGFLDLPKSLVQTITVPIQYGLYKTGTDFAHQLGFIISARYAAQENKALRAQLGGVLVENSVLQKRVREAESMIDTYNKLSPQTYDLVPARIIGMSRLLVIDKGSEAGVSINDVVVFKDNLIGTVKVVSPKTSQIILSADPDSKIAVFSQGSTGRAKGILQGQFGSQILMDKILHQEEIMVGDLVYSEGIEGKLPKGLIVGKVTQVLERENEIFKQAKVEALFDLTDLDVVFVIRSS